MSETDAPPMTESDIAHHLGKLEQGLFGSDSVVPSSPPSSHKPKLGKDKTAATYGQEKMGAEKGASEDDDDEKIAKEKAAKEKAAKEKAAAQKDAMFHDKDEKIATLTASVQQLQNQLTIQQSKSMITEMLTARSRAGMPRDQMTAFANQFFGKSQDEITQFYNNEKMLHASTQPLVQPLVASEPAAPQNQLGIEIPFNGALTASGSADTLEELLK